MSGSSDVVGRLAAFLVGHAAAVAADLASGGSTGVGGFQSTLDGHNAAIGKDDADQRATADDFNLLDVLGIADRETKHCRVLAWLLDHRRRELGTHAQGNVGFALFLRAVGLPADYSEGNYQVRREVRGKASRIDVEVCCRGQFLIHVEA